MSLFRQDGKDMSDVYDFQDSDTSSDEEEMQVKINVATLTMFSVLQTICRTEEGMELISEEAE